MSFLEKCVHALQYQIESPGNYGVFHIIFLLYTVLMTVFLCVKFKNSSDKVYRRIFLIFWIVMLALEVYKQLVFSFNYNEGSPVWDYQWYSFPYQLCSTPLYVMPFIAFMKDGRAREYFTAYMMTFPFFGGLAVMLYPNDVFHPYLGINLQTMIHHSTQVILGIFTAVYFRKNLKHKLYFKSIATFSVLSLVAIISNYIMYHSGILNGETFNMFYISPYFDCTLPILSGIYSDVRYPVFLIIYLLGFTLVSAIMFYGQKGIIYLTSKYKKS